MEDFLSNYLNISKNETIHKQDIEDSLKNAIITNYQKLLSEQVASCNVRKYEFLLSDMKPVIRLPGEEASYTDVNRYGYQINEGIVKYDRRHILPSLGLLNKRVTQDEISKDEYDVFEKNYICFIDNYMVDCLEVAVLDDYTMFILNVEATGTETDMSRAKFNELIENGAKVTLYTVPNFYKESLRINNATLVAKLAGSISFDRLGNPDTFDENTIFFINTTPEYALKTMVECDVTENSVEVLDLEKLDSVRYVIDIINLPFYQSYKTFTEDSWFQLSDYKYPIPNVNMFPIVLNGENGTKMNDIQIESYYPNVYKITGIHSGDTVKLGFSYSESNWVSCDNRLYMFYKYFPDVLPMYENGKIPDVVKDFQPVNIPYYSKLYDDTVHLPYTFAVKVDKFKSFMEQDYKYLVHYLYTKLKGKMRHYIYMNKLDLPSRVRKDNRNECFFAPSASLELYDDAYQIVTFPEERYLFSLPKAIFGPDEEFRFYLDNLAVMPSLYHLQADADWYHLYIPCSMVTTESILEIEKFPKYRTDVVIPPEQSMTGTFTFVKPKEVSHVYVNNMHMYNATTKEFIPSNAYTIKIKDHYTGDEIVVTNNSRASIIDTAEITIIDPKYIGIPIVVGIKTYPRFYYNADANEVMGIDAYNDVEITDANIRPYVDGIFLTPHLFLNAYDTDTSGLYNGIVKININAELTDRNFMVDVMPSPMRLEYSKRGVFCDEKGFVDTGSMLSLPFDLKWYDVYVNGRKLNKSNVEIISPNKFFVKGIHSRKNIEIWLRGDGPTEFLFNQYNMTTEDKLWDVEEIRKVITDNQDILDDSLADITDEVIINILAELEDFINSIMKYMFINPNEQQLSQSIEQRYPDLFNEYDIMWLDSNTCTDASFLTFINSNERDEEMKNGQYRFGFTPMYIGSHEDALPGEYMCDPVTGLPGVKDVNDETILPGGSIQRLVCHRNNFANILARNGYTDMTIYQLEFEENTTAKVVTRDTNVLDVEEFDVRSAVNSELTPQRIAFSMDVDVLEEGFNSVMRLSQYDPTVQIDYKYIVTNGQIEKTGTFTAKVSALADSVLNIVTTVEDESGSMVQDACTGFTITDFKLVAESGDEGTFDAKKVILHSILIAF